MQGFEDEEPVEETIETIKEDENVSSETFEETPTEESFEEVSEPINNEEIVQDEVVPEEPLEEEVIEEQEANEEPVSEVEAEIVSENEDVVASEIIESDTENSADLIEESELNKEKVSKEVPEETPVIKKRRKRRKITLRLGEPNSKYTRKPSEPKEKSKLELKPKRVSAKPVQAELPPIPGRFIVKTPKGYYVEKGVYSKEKSDAYIFRDFNKAKALERVEGGKVVKL